MVQLNNRNTFFVLLIFTILAVLLFNTISATSQSHLHSQSESSNDSTQQQKSNSLLPPSQQSFQPTQSDPTRRLFELNKSRLEWAHNSLGSFRFEIYPSDFTLSERYELFFPRPLNSPQPLNSTLRLEIYDGYFSAPVTGYLYLSVENNCLELLSNLCRDNELYPGIFFPFTMPTSSSQHALSIYVDISFQLSEVLRPWFLTNGDNTSQFPPTITFDVIFPLDTFSNNGWASRYSSVDITLTQERIDGVNFFAYESQGRLVLPDKSILTKVDLTKAWVMNPNLIYGNTLSDFRFQLVTERDGFIPYSIEKPRVVPVSPTRYQFLRFSETRQTCTGIHQRDDKSISRTWQYDWNFSQFEVTQSAAENFPRVLSVNCPNSIAYIRPGHHYIWPIGSSAPLRIGSGRSDYSLVTSVEPYRASTYTKKPKSMSVSEYLERLFIMEPIQTSEYTELYLFMKLYAAGSGVSLESSYRFTQTPSKGGGGGKLTSKTIGIIVGCVIGGIIALLIFICCVVICVSKSKKGSGNNSKEQQHKSQAVQVLDLSTLQPVHSPQSTQYPTAPMQSPQPQPHQQVVFQQQPQYGGPQPYVEQAPPPPAY